MIAVLFVFVVDGPKCTWRLYKNSVEYSSITSNTALQIDTWYHVAGVFDGSQLKIYVQGRSDAMPVSVSYSNQGGTSNLKIGVSPEGAYFLNWLIDEVRVTARPVYTTDFTAQHKLTGVVDTKGLWRFDRPMPRTALISTMAASSEDLPTQLLCLDA